MVFVVTEACVDVQDKSCMQICPADCIFEGGRMTYINPDMCIDCGACEPVCPVEAIYFDADVPDEQQPFLDVNERFFQEFETPTSGRKAGKIFFDVDTILAMPPRGGE